MEESHPSYGSIKPAGLAYRTFQVFDPATGKARLTTVDCLTSGMQMNLHDMRPECRLEFQMKKNNNVPESPEITSIIPSLNTPFAAAQNVAFRDGFYGHLHLILTASRQ